MRAKDGAARAEHREDFVGTESRAWCERQVVEYKGGTERRAGLPTINGHVATNISLAAQLRYSEVGRRIRRQCATYQDQSVQPPYAATPRGVMPVGLIRAEGARFLQ